MQKYFPLLVVACCLSLTACSKKAEEHATDSSAEINAATAPAEQPTQKNTEPSNTEALDVQTQPVTEQKPEQILNNSINPAEKNRRMVREASVQFSAQDVIKTTLAIDKLTLDAGGFIEQKNIYFNVSDVRQQKLADGKIKVFEKVEPYAELIVRIPSGHAADFVNRMLPLMHFLNAQQYSAKRQELKLLEEKINQVQSLPEHSKNAQLNEIARLTELEVQDRIRYSTVVLRIDQPSLVRERYDIDLSAVSQQNADGFWSRAWDGIKDGWLFILDFLIILIRIWPFYLILIIGFLLYRLVKPLITKLK